jgi:hypothetical protein
MGTWFPDYRTGTPEQCRDYRDAHAALFRNSRYEGPLVRDKVIRDETERYLDLNDRAWDSGRPLHPVQRWWHWHRALGAEDREFTRMQRRSDGQDRERRRTGRSR